MDAFAGLPAFALASFLIELTPGPNMAWLAMLAAMQGRRRGFAAVAGVSLGLAIMGALAGLGLAALLAAEPALYNALRWAGVLYLLYLAWDGWKDAGLPAEEATGITAGAAFRRGLVTNLLNPKAAAFYVTVLPAFLPSTGASADVTLWFAATYVLVATLVHGAIVALAGTASGVLSNDDRRRVVGRLLSIALAFVAVWFAVKSSGV